MSDRTRRLPMALTACVLVVSTTTGCGGEGKATTPTTLAISTRIDLCQQSIRAVGKRMQDLIVSSVSASGLDVDGEQLTDTRDRVAAARRECTTTLPECAEAIATVFDQLDGMLDDFLITSLDPDLVDDDSSSPGATCEGTELMRESG